MKELKKKEADHLVKPQTFSFESVFKKSGGERIKNICQCVIVINDTYSC